MNDPFKCLGVAESIYTPDQLQEFRLYAQQRKSALDLKLSLLSDKKLNEVINKVRNAATTKFAFGSLTERFDDILMWSYYAQGHAGFVLGIEIDPMDYHLKQVQYYNTLPPFDPTFFAKFMDSAVHPPAEEENETMNYILSNFSMKSECWAHEKEWRVWRKHPSYFHYKTEDIKEVYFGINCPIESKIIVGNLLEMPATFNFNEMIFLDNPVRLGVK
jgi:hypothetical protein